MLMEEKLTSTGLMDLLDKDLPYFQCYPGSEVGLCQVGARKTHLPEDSANL